MWSSNQKNNCLKKYLETFVENKLAEIFTTKPKVWQIPPPFGKWKLCLVFTDYFSSLSLSDYSLSATSISCSPGLPGGNILHKMQKKKGDLKIVQQNLCSKRYLSSIFSCRIFPLPGPPDCLRSRFPPLLIPSDFAPHLWYFDSYSSILLVISSS